MNRMLDVFRPRGYDSSVVKIKNLKGEEEDMRKIMSVFIAVCLVLSLFTGIFVSMPSARADTTYAITFSVTGANGTLGATVASVAIATGALVAAGETVAFTAVPATGYQVKAWTMNGTAAAGRNTIGITVPNLAGAIAITVEFEAITSTTNAVTFSVTGANGTLGATVDSVAIATGALVAGGKHVVFTAVPATGYQVKEWTADGTVVEGDTTNTLEISSPTVLPAVMVEFEAITDVTPVPVPVKNQTVLVLHIGKSMFTVNGASKTLDSPPIIKNSRTLLPIRAIIEALGGTVAWDPIAHKVTVTLGTKTVVLWIGKSVATVNGVSTPIDATDAKVVPEIINSRTMLPLRFVAENLGATVVWAAATQTITITYTP